MTNEEIQAEVATLPVGIYRDTARASIAYLMKSRNLSLTNATLEFSAMVQDTGEAYDRAARRKNSTGVR